MAEALGVEAEEDLAQLSDEDVAAAVAALGLQKVFANKLKEAVKAAQVFSLLLASCDSI